MAWPGPKTRWTVVVLENGLDRNFDVFNTDVDDVEARVTAAKAR